jgi:hypothetical protein
MVCGNPYSFAWTSSKQPNNMFTQRFTPVLAFLLLFLNGCTHLVHLDRAQNAFNRGATMENTLAFGTASASVDLQTANPNIFTSQGVGTLSPDLHYQLAYSEVGKALKSEGSLKSDGVLGTALMLRTLCEWKLGRYDEARTSAGLAQKALADNKFRQPRDEAVVGAIEGLISSEQAYIALLALRQKLAQQKTTPADDVARLRFFDEIRKHYDENISNLAGNGKIDNALTILAKTREQTIARQDLQLYFVLSQLASLKTWLDELNEIYLLIKTFGYANADNDLNRWFLSENARFAKKRDDVLPQLAILLPGKELHANYKNWKMLLLN